MNKDTPQNNPERLENARQVWNIEALTFDDESDHGLRDPDVRNAWASLLKKLLPAPPAVILDMGCGTGSVSLLMADLGLSVTGLDLSPAMLTLAESKARAAGHSIKFHCMDAAFPELPPHQFDVIICRHVLWALPEPVHVLHRWITLLKDCGSLILIEGFWETGAGLHTRDLVDMLPTSMTQVMVRDLSNLDALWGKSVTDERYAVTAVSKPQFDS
jgi:2-polyprenyl-3-methyl-5-hydroxy-6-metoxy-1,4-benzoquinol methylase